MPSRFDDGRAPESGIETAEIKGEGISIPKVETGTRPNPAETSFTSILMRPELIYLRLLR
jgi:hypothetical protein